MYTAILAKLYVMREVRKTDKRTGLNMCAGTYTDYHT